MKYEDAVIGLGCALAFSGIATDVAAGGVTPPQSIQVVSLEGPKSATNGFLLITPSVPVPGCEAGFWLPGTDASYSSRSARAMLALGQRITIVVTGDSDQRWPESTQSYCKVVDLR